MIEWDVLKKQSGKNPKKLLYSVLLLSVVFFGIWLLALSNSSQSPTYVSIKSAPSAADSFTQNKEVKSDSIFAKTIEFGKLKKPVQSTQTSRSFWPPVLFLIVGLFMFLIWVKRKEKQPVQDSVIQIISSQNLDAGQQISIVKINGEYLVLGNSSAGIQLLRSYNSEKWLEGNTTDNQEIKDNGFLAMLNHHKKTMN